MIVILYFVVAFAVIVFVFINQPQFGKSPAGERLELIKNSPNFKNGKFQNLNHTPDLTEGVSFYTVLKEFLFADKSRTAPKNLVPTVKTDLHNLPVYKNVLVWFGHSSYFMQVDGKKILVDPVLSGSASPIAATARSFKGSDIYSPADIPEIDFLFITHDHWDHLDYKTIKELKTKIKKVICSLGTGEHLEHWGFDKNIIIEKDWNEQIQIENSFIVNTVPARHFSGRGFVRNKAMWTSYVLQTPTMKIFIGGDSGYDTHFADIGKKFGNIDLAILECGQYDKNWKYIHMQPEEVLQAAKDLNATNLLAVHNSKFKLANHNWDEPLSRVAKLSVDAGFPIHTPMIGEALPLDFSNAFSQWWTTIK